MQSDEEDNSSEDVPSHDDNKTQNRRQHRQNAKQIRNFQKVVKRMNLKICDSTKKLQDLTHTKKRELNAVEDIVNFAKKHILGTHFINIQESVEGGSEGGGGGGGRSWIIKDKGIAVGLYHASPKVYALLCK